MNTEPHEHQLQIAHRGTMYIYLDYGDQSTEVMSGRFLLNWRMKRKARMLVRRHNKASKRADTEFNPEVAAKIAAAREAKNW
jgi:hypothetical protein